MSVLKMEKPRKNRKGVFIPIIRGKFRNHDLKIMIDKEDLEEFSQYSWGLYKTETSACGEILFIKGSRQDTLKEISISSLIRMKYGSAIPGLTGLSMKKKFYQYKVTNITLTDTIINYRKMNLIPIGPTIWEGTLQDAVSEYEKEHPEMWFNLSEWLQCQIERSK